MKSSIRVTPLRPHRSLVPLPRLTLSGKLRWVYGIAAGGLSVCAIEAGTHRSYARQSDGTEHLDATARFTTAWSKQSGAWQVVRTISYDL